jgi:hypothetical protein
LTAGAVPDATAFGRAVFGPIFAEFALRLWLFLSALENPEEACVLFCARGGLRLQYIFELFIRRTGLACPVSANPLMVSRLVAVRPALLRRSPIALDEIEREFAGCTMGRVAAALAQSAPPGGSQWDEAFRRDRLYDLLFADFPTASQLRRVVAEQHELFAAHLSRMAHGRRRLILCDTGLFGSTVKLLADGMPQFDWGCVLLARCNYKRFSAEHFARTCGLTVESDCYSPRNPRTALLRYWHLVEAMLEPDLPSVATFCRDAAGEIRCNLECPGWRERLPPDGPGLFAGVVDYIDALDPRSFFATIDAERAAAWKSLKRALVFPRPADLVRLMPGRRSHDFGRPGDIAVLAPCPNPKAGFFARLRSVRRSLWREGAVVGSFRRLARVILVAIETAYAARWAYGSLRSG